MRKIGIAFLLILLLTGCSSKNSQEVTKSVTNDVNKSLENVSEDAQKGLEEANQEEIELEFGK